MQGLIARMGDGMFCQRLCQPMEEGGAAGGDGLTCQLLTILWRPCFSCRDQDR